LISYILRIILLKLITLIVYKPFISFITIYYIGV